MMKIEIREIKPLLFLNGGQRGWKVLQYETINGDRWLVGSRLFEGKDGAEQYKRELERKYEIKNT